MNKYLETAKDVLNAAGTFLKNVRDYPYGEAASTLWNYPYLKKTHQLIRDTHFEAIAIALAGSVLWGTSVYRDRAARAGEIPLAFGEVEQITATLGKQGKQLGPISKFYLWTSEVTMKIFESNNIAVAFGDSNESFARELETRVDPAMKVWAQLPEYTVGFENVAQDALKAMDKYVQAANRLPAANDNLDNAWSYGYRDDTHQKTHYKRQCDSEGKNCRQVVDYIETICDRRHHTYTFNASAGIEASRQLDAFIAAYPDLVVTEDFVLATQTGADNEYAIEKSRQRELKNRRLTPQELLGYANTWATGSNFMNQKPVIEKNYDNLIVYAGAWREALKTAKTTRYTTPCSLTPSPLEYDVAENTQTQGRETVQSVHRVIDGIVVAQQKVPQLLTLSKRHIAATLDVERAAVRENPTPLRKEIMSTSRQIYDSNIGNGFDIWPFKWGEVAFYSLGGLFLFTALGVGIDRGIDKFKLLGERQRGEKDIPWPDLPDGPNT